MIHIVPPDPYQYPALCFKEGTRFTFTLCFQEKSNAVGVCVCLSRRRCRRCVFCQSRRMAACWPCWTDGPTGASPDSEAGASRSQSSTTERLGRLSSPSRLIHSIHADKQACTHARIHPNTSCTFFRGIADQYVTY